MLSFISQMFNLHNPTSRISYGTILKTNYKIKLQTRAIISFLCDIRKGIVFLFFCVFFCFLLLFFGTKHEDLFNLPSSSLVNRHCKFHWTYLVYSMAPPEVGQSGVYDWCRAITPGQPLEETGWSLYNGPIQRVFSNIGVLYYNVR